LDEDARTEHTDVGGETARWRGEPEGGEERLSSTVSAEVRAIFEAAERSAEEIRRQSELKAGAIREAAAERARQIRSDAIAQAREELTGISQGTDQLLGDIETRIRELASLVQTLRSDADRLVTDLTELETDPEPALTIAGEPSPEPEPAPADASAEEQAAIRATAPFAGDSDEARLLALNMALNGAPRAEIERYLSENFDLEEPDRLLDAVYRRVGR
jgi:hypothetical protein